MDKPCRRRDIRDEELNGHYIDWEMIESKGWFGFHLKDAYYGRKRNDKFYQNWRYRCLKRDNKTCLLCGSHSKLHVHHLLRWHDKPTARYYMENGATLCTSCHKAGHGPTGHNFPQELTTKIVKIMAERGQVFEKCPELVNLLLGQDISRHKTRLIKRHT